MLEVVFWIGIDRAVKNLVVMLDDFGSLPEIAMLFGVWCLNSMVM